MATEVERAAMRAAIALAAFGLGTTSPNPPVGCVILDVHGRVVGEGYHERKGEPHAEVYALTAAGDHARDGTAVVILEPCNHYGRSPPCRQALIDAGVARVVIAVTDPTSREEGGAIRLRAAGIDVETDVLADEARLVLGPWLTALRAQRPYVHWFYARDEEGPREVEMLPEFAVLRNAIDAVLWPDGQLEEGTPGTHNPDVFSLPASVATDQLEGTLTDLHRRGVRTLLLAGWSPIVEPLIEGERVDQVTAYIAAPSASHPTNAPPDPRAFAPGRLRMSSVTRAGIWARMTLARQ